MNLIDYTFVERNLRENVEETSCRSATKGERFKRITSKFPTDAFINVTSRCNARCIMCDNWRRPPPQELEPEVYSKLPKLKYINVSGGEPFLRDDLPEIVKVLHKSCCNPKIDIATNGLLPEKIRDLMDEILGIDRKVGVRVSIDGIGKRHDEVRGIKGTFDRAIKSVQLLKEVGVKDLGIAYVMTNLNVDQLPKVMKLAKKLKVQYTVCGIAHNSELTFSLNNKSIENLVELRRQFDYVTKLHLKSFNPIDWVRACWDSGNYFYASVGRRKFPCFAGTAFFFMNPNGDIHPCMVLDHKLGNIKSQFFFDIWDSRKAIDFRNKIAHVSNCPTPCWMSCTVFPHLRRNKLSFIKWLIKNKLKAHLGLPITPIQG